MKNLHLGLAKSSKDLSDLYNQPIEFTKPEVKFLKNVEFTKAMEGKLNLFPQIDIIEQSFWGNISGTGFILLNAQKTLVDVRVIGGSSNVPATEAETCKTILQITNSMTATCMSNLAELLKDQIDFSSSCAIMNIDGDCPAGGFKYSMKYLIS